MLLEGCSGNLMSRVRFPAALCLGSVGYGAGFRGSCVITPAPARPYASWQVSVMDKDNQIKYDPRGWQMPDGKPDKPKGAKNVREYSYDKGHSFCGYRACMQIRGVEYCRYFSARELGWENAFNAAVVQAEQWRALRHRVNQEGGAA